MSKGVWNYGSSERLFLLFVGILELGSRLGKRNQGIIEPSVSCLKKKNPFGAFGADLGSSASAIRYIQVRCSDPAAGVIGRAVVLVFCSDRVKKNLDRRAPVMEKKCTEHADGLGMKIIWG